jgi:hypothetical protein
MKPPAATLLLATLTLLPACAGRDSGADAKGGAVSGAADAAAPAEVAEAARPSPQSVAAAAGSREDAIAGVAALCGRTERPPDAVVTVAGLYHGFRVEGCAFPACVARASLTRSDWLLRTGGDCVYVTGGAPQGVDPFDPSFSGRRIEIRSHVVKDGDGKLRLHYLDGRLLDA